MRTTPVVPADVVFDGDGAPRSPRHGDVYHPANGALDQCRHVFLAGNGLPQRWRGRPRFVVLETGFGLGNNALATWQAWRDDDGRCERLVFVSIEAHPPTREQLRAAPRDPSLLALRDELLAAWPPLTCNLHRLTFEHGRVEFLLAFGDVAAWLPQIGARVDAFYLDGFAPARNPGMWQPRLLKAMARMAAPGATAATWSAARVVRDGLRSAGFEVRAAPGQGGKRDITLAAWSPRPAMPRPSTDPPPPRPPGDAARIAVIGAGLAGSALVQALARQGLRSVLIDAADAPASGASGNPAGLFHGVVHADDGPHARWFRAAALMLAGELRGIADDALPSGRRGLLRLAPGVAVGSLQAVAERHGLPADHVCVVDAAEAADLAGCAVAAGGWWFPGGGWVDAAALVRHRLAAAADACEPLWGRRVARLLPAGDAGRWCLLDADDRPIASADAVVCCNGTELAPLLARSGIALDAPLESWRGQLSSVGLTAGLPAAPRVPVAGSGYAVAAHGRLWFGAHGERDDGAAPDPLPSAAGHAHNLRRLGALLPDWSGAVMGDRPLQARVGWRSGSADRLPLVGAVPAPVAPASVPERLRDVPRVAGLWLLAALGSRGIVSSRLGADLLAAQLAGSPLPIEADLVAAVDPGRYTRRRLRGR